MSNPIKSEIGQFVLDYINQKDPDLLNGSGDDLKHDYKKLRNRIYKIFQNDRVANPHGKSIKEYFRSESKDELKQRLLEVRERTQLKSAVPLSQWVSFAESVVTHEDDDTRQEYDELFNTGLVQDQLRRNLRFENDYEERDLTFLISNQSGEVNRSIVEIVSNAIDFSPVGSDVYVEITDTGYSVTDFGKGMSPQNLIEQLSIPFISGARDMEKASIGKFGMGFLTVLRHLKNEGDLVKVETAQEGRGYAISFFVRDGKIFVSIELQEEMVQGTRVSLVTSDFDPENAKDLLVSHLKYKHGADVIVNGENISQLDGLTYQYSGETTTDRVGLGFEFQDEISHSNCELVLAINGIKIVGQSIEGFNLPTRLILDLPYVTNLSESRDVVVYDEFFITAAKRVVDDLLGSELTTQQKIQIANALSELFYTVELQAFTHDESMLEYLEVELSLAIDQSRYKMVPAEKGWQHIAGGELLFVNPHLEALIEPFFNELSPMAGMRSTNLRGYVADIDPMAEHPILQHGNKFVFSKQLWIELRTHPEYLQAYINFMLKDKGLVEFSKLKKSEKSTESNNRIKKKMRGMTYQEECEQKILDPDNILDGYLSQIIFDINLLFTDEDESSKYEYLTWLGHLTLPQECRSELLAYLLGETDTFSFKTEWLSQAVELHRMVIVEDMPPDQLRESIYSKVLALAERLPEIEDGFNRYKKIMEFFIPENIQKYLEMSPDEIENRFCADFVDQFSDSYGEFFKRVAKQMIRWDARYLEDDRELTIEDISHNFSFLLAVIGDITDVNNRYSAEKTEVNFAKKIPEHAKYVITRMISALTARIHYLQVKNQLGAENHQAYDALFSFYWSSQLINPDDLLKNAHLSRHNIIENNASVIQGIGLVAQTFPSDQIEDLISVLMVDSKVPLDDIYPLFIFLVDPYAAYHSITNGGNWSSDSGKLEDLPLALGKKLHGMDLVKTYFDRDGDADKAFAWKYRYTNLKTFEDFEETVREKWEIAQSQFPNLATKYQAIYGNEIIQHIFEERGRDIKEAFTKAMSSQSYVEYESFSVSDIMLFTEGCFAPLSEKKLQIVLKTVEEKFNPNFMDRNRCAQFAIYLRRVFAMAHLSDEEFENLQDWLMIKKEYNNWHVFLNDFYADSIIAVLREKQSLVGKDGIGYVADIWGSIINSIFDFSRGKSDEELAVYVSRLIDIVEDILRKPKYLQDFIFKALEKTGESYDRYSCLFREGKNFSQLSSFLQPYVIYFNKGDRTTLDAQNNLFSDGLNKGKNQLLLSDLMHHKRTRSSDFKKDVISPEDFPEKVQKSAEGKNKFVYHRELLHSIQHLPANDTYLFLRELIQNAYDASASSQESVHHEINIDNFKLGGLHVVQVQDSVGMNFEKIFSTLLIPNVSSKVSGEEIGRFGVGFMSIFKDAERVEIVSEDGEQKVTVVILPVLNDQGRLIDLEVSYDVTSSNGKGSIVRKYFKAENSQLESAKIQASANKYGTYLDFDRVRLCFGEETINYPKRVLASLYDDRFGVLEILEGNNAQLLQGRLYVNELPPYVLELVPDPILDLVLNHGLVINIDPRVGLTRSRKDLSDKNDVLPSLRKVLPGLIIEATIQKFADGQFDLNLIPYDYFWSLEPGIEIWMSQIDDQTINDAELINDGVGLDDWLRYCDRRFFLELLTLIKFVEVGGIKRSLQEINDLRKQGFDFSNENLPQRISSLLKDSKELTEHQIRLKDEFQERNETEFQIKVLGKELFDKLKDVSDGHLAFLDFIDAMTSIDGNILHGYFNVPKAARAVAAIDWSLKAWNLLYFDSEIEKLSRIIQSRDFDDELLYRLMADVINTSTHEDTHIDLGTNHWGDHHNEIFWERQRTLWSGLVKRHYEVLADVKNRLQNYEGTCLRREDVAKIISS